MKAKEPILALVAGLVVFGCEVNGITDPPMEASATDSHLLRDAPQGTILLDEVLTVPGFPTPIQITGQVDFSTRIITRDPPPPAPQRALVVSLALDAVLSPVDHQVPVWHVGGSSLDEFGIGEDEGVIMLEKTYAIPEWTPGSRLHIEFRIESHAVSVARIWIVRVCDVSS